MFPNCLDRFGCQKRNKTIKNKERKAKENLPGIKVPIINHYPRNG